MIGPLKRDITPMAFHNLSDIDESDGFPDENQLIISLFSLSGKAAPGWIIVCFSPKQWQYVELRSKPLSNWRAWQSGR